MFVRNRLTNCASLLEEIENGTYKPSPVEKFTILERGKIRDVKPVNFRDRVAQRCVCDNILVPLIEDTVIDDNSACIKGRGLSYAYDRVRMHAEKCPYDGWVLQFDFSKYFSSIDQSQLVEMLRSLIDDDKIMDFLEVTIKDDKGGLELGSHVSQLCAMMYPDSMDKAISVANGVNGYHRYMDDGVVFCDDKKSALRAMEILVRESEKLCLNLNARKTHIEPVKQPFVFCKMRFSKIEDGTVRMNVRKKQSR